MTFHSLKSLSAVALAGMFAFNASAESISEEYVIDFTTMEVGTLLNSFWGAQNPGFAVIESPEGDGNVFYVSGTDGTSDEGYLTWNTLARVTPFALPKGFTLDNVTMITAEYMPTQEDGKLFGIQLQSQSEYLTFEETPVVNDWNIAVFDPHDLVNADGASVDLTKSYDFCFGIYGSTNYYVKNITFYLEKEVTQREKDEAALDKSTAACVEFNFDNWDVSGEVDGAYSSPHLGSNGGSLNRPDMIIDKGPDDYNNNCAHVIYSGWTPIFITDAVEVPEGYTCDDLRLIEYDIYETDLAGEDYTNGNSSGARNGAPLLRIKDVYPNGWHPVGDGTSAGNVQLPTVNEWHHVEFYPSAFGWTARDFKQNVLDENGDPMLDENGETVQEEIHWDVEKVQEEFFKLTSFNISIGFFPCNAQCYVDNVKCWFQKGSIEAVDGIAAEKASNVIYNIYGQRVDENYRGIIIKNGKKYINK